MNFSKDKWAATESSLREFSKRLEAELAQARSRVQTASAEANARLEKALAELAGSEAKMQKMQVLIDESQVSHNLLLLVVIISFVVLLKFFKTLFEQSFTQYYKYQPQKKNSALCEDRKRKRSYLSEL